MGSLNFDAIDLDTRDFDATIFDFLPEPKVCSVSVKVGVDVSSFYNSLLFCTKLNQNLKSIQWTWFTKLYYG